jgi:Flp pilus assembly protein TadD
VAIGIWQWKPLTHLISASQNGDDVQGALGSETSLPWWQYFPTAVAAIVDQLAWAVARGLALDIQVRPSRPWDYRLVGVVAMIALAELGFIAGDTPTRLALMMMLFSPSLAYLFIPTADVIRQDRSYFAAIALTLLIGHVWPYPLVWFAIGASAVWRYTHQKTWSHPVTLWHHATRVSPKSARVWLTAGAACHYYGKDPERAEACYRRAIVLRPTLAPALSNLGVLYQERGDLLSAERHYRQATLLGPQWNLSWVNLSEVLLHLNRPLEALDAAKQAVHVDAASEDSWAAMGTSYERLGDYSKAADAFGRAYALCPDRVLYRSCADQMTEKDILERVRRAVAGESS